jgi:hypothetical protein
MPVYVGDALMAHARGGCYRCARGDRLVDMDAQIEGEGALAICAGCITEAAETAGLTFNEARVRELEAELATARRAEDAGLDDLRDRVLSAIAEDAARPAPAKKRTTRG